MSKHTFISQVDRKFFHSTFTICYIFIGLTMSSILSAQEIYLDESFSDWANTFEISDEGDNVFFDIESLNIAHDDDNIYFKLKFNTEILLQADNTLSLDIIADEFSVQYTFGYRVGEITTSNFSREVYQNDLGLIITPTVTSEEFELKINRLIDLGNISYYLDDRINLKISSLNSTADEIPNNGELIDYDLTEVIQTPTTELVIEKNDDSDFRLMSMNALRDRIFDNNASSAYSNILKAIDPDIISFQEIYDHSSQETQNRILDVFNALDPNAPWYNSKHGNDCILISRYPIIFSQEVAGNGVFIINKGGQDIMIINAHLPCCDNNSGREREIDELLAFIRNSRDGMEDYKLNWGTPIIITGDMNFVGNANQIEAFESGTIFNNAQSGMDFMPDWNNTGLQDLRPFTSGTNTQYTWLSESSSYSAGRLDFIFYSDFTLQATNSFCLDTRAMANNTLEAYGLSVNDSRFASDHIPVVVDFRQLNPVNTSDQEISEILFYPNPAHDLVIINEIIAHKAQTKIYNNLGQEVLSSTKPIIAIDQLDQGYYLVQISFDNKIYTHPIIID